MSDLVINVRQVGSYPPQQVEAGDLVLLQQGGLGGPYYTTTPLGFLAPLEGASLNVGVAMPPAAGRGNVLAQSFVMPVTGEMLWNAYRGTDTSYLNTFPGALSARLAFQPTLGGLTFGVAPAQPGNSRIATFINLWELDLAGNMTLPRGTLTVARDPTCATEVATMGWVGASTVASFNGRRGNVILWDSDIYRALSLDSPIATESFVRAALCQLEIVCSFNGREGRVELNSDDITRACLLAPLAIAQTNTPAPLDRSYRIANTAWVTDFCYGPFWQDLQTSFTPDLSGYAPLNSPAFTGTPTVPTANVTANNSQIANTNWVYNYVNLTLIPFAPIASPNFTGTPTAPTANAGTSTGQVATTAFVMAAVTSATTGVISWNDRTGAVELEAADINDVGGALLDSPSFTGTPTVPMAAGGIGSNQIASTAWVLSEIAAISAGVTTWNGRSGIVTLQAADLTAVGAALLASPAFTGAPTAPTATLGTNSTQLATTAFVIAQLNALQYVGSFNGRSGVVTLTANDISGAGGLANPSPALTGTPTAPTAIPGTNTTQIASCAFVQNAIANFTGGGILVGTSPPATPQAGAGWFNMNDAQLYVWTGAQWVIAVNPPTVDTSDFVTDAALSAALAGYLPLTGGSLSGQLNINATASQIGLNVTSNASIQAVISGPGGSVDTVLGLTLPGIGQWRLATQNTTNNFYINFQGSTYTPFQIIPNGAINMWCNVLNLNSLATNQDCAIYLTVPNVWTWRIGVANASGGSPGTFYLNNAATDTNALMVDGGNTFRVYENQVNGGFINATAFNLTSDPQVKTAIRSYTDGIAAISHLDPITFRYNGFGNTPVDPATVTRVGLDASKVQAVLPDAVSSRRDKLRPNDADDTDLLMIDNGVIVMTLINAAKQLLSRVEVLEAVAKITPTAAQTA